MAMLDNQMVSPAMVELIGFRIYFNSSLYQITIIGFTNKTQQVSKLGFARGFLHPKFAREPKHNLN